MYVKEERRDTLGREERFAKRVQYALLSKSLVDSLEKEGACYEGIFVAACPEADLSRAQGRQTQQCAADNCSLQHFPLTFLVLLLGWVSLQDFANVLQSPFYAITFWVVNPPMNPHNYITKTCRKRTAKQCCHIECSISMGIICSIIYKGNTHKVIVLYCLCSNQHSTIIIMLHSIFIHITSVHQGSL